MSIRSIALLMLAWCIPLIHSAQSNVPFYSPKDGIAAYFPSEPQVKKSDSETIEGRRYSTTVKRGDGWTTYAIAVLFNRDGSAFVGPGWTAEKWLKEYLQGYALTLKGRVNEKKTKLGSFVDKYPYLDFEVEYTMLGNSCLNRGRFILDGSRLIQVSVTATNSNISEVQNALSPFLQSFTISAPIGGR